MLRIMSECKDCNHSPCRAVLWTLYNIMEHRKGLSFPDDYMFRVRRWQFRNPRELSCVDVENTGNIRADNNDTRIIQTFCDQDHFCPFHMN